MQAQVLQRGSARSITGAIEGPKHQSARSWNVNHSPHVVSTLHNREASLHKRGSDSRIAQHSPVWEIEDWTRRESNYATSSSAPIGNSLVSVPLPVPVPIRESMEQEALLPLPRDVENLADDPSLHNPLERSARMSTSWFGVVMEYDGVVVEATSDLQRKAWLKVAELEGKNPPPMWQLNRAEGMKNNQIVQEIFCWTREPMEVRRICDRKEAVLSEIHGDMQPLLSPELPRFMESLAANKVPAVLVTSDPEKRIKPAVSSLGLDDAFVGVVSAEDTYRGRPDPEPYLLAAQMMKRPHARCVVVGNSNQSVEAAKECGMAVVVVAGRKPLYELKAADLVVKNLGELRLINLQQLFRNEDLVAAQEQEPQKDPEMTDEDDFYEDTSLW